MRRVELAMVNLQINFRVPNFAPFKDNTELPYLELWVM